MKTDVQTLIGALTTERDSLTKAIEALKLIRTDEPQVSATPKAAAVKKTRQKRASWRVDDAKRTQIIARMSAAKAGNEPLYRAARALQRETGIKATTILSAWQRWNGTAAPVDTPTTETAEMTA